MDKKIKRGTLAIAGLYLASMLYMGETTAEYLIKKNQLQDYTRAEKELFQKKMDKRFNTAVYVFSGDLALTIGALGYLNYRAKKDEKEE